MARRLRVLALCSLLIGTTTVWSQDWQPVTGADNLKALFSDTTQTAELASGVTAVATYNSDGTGELRAWGDTFDRSWQVQGGDQVCFDIGTEPRCFTIEVDASSPNTYRGTLVGTGQNVVFTVEQRSVAISESNFTASGGAGEPSAEEIAAKLANPLKV